jgi:hypothetical protein
MAVSAHYNPNRADVPNVREINACVFHESERSTEARNIPYKRKDTFPDT